MCGVVLAVDDNVTDRLPDPRCRRVLFTVSSRKCNRRSPLLTKWLRAELGWVVDKHYQLVFAGNNGPITGVEAKTIVATCVFPEQPPV